MISVIPLRISLILLFLPLAAPSGLRVFLPVSVFSYDKNPDIPLSEYAAGNLGIILPGYARSYLYVAYRYLEGTPFTAEEQTKMNEVWEFRIHGKREGPRRAREAWQDLRRSLPVPPPLSIDKRIWNLRATRTRGYAFRSTCTSDSFLRASERLIQLRDQFGAASAAFKSWVLAQDLVFDQCTDQMPLPPLEDGLPTAIRIDRQYQRAASLFHGINLEAAESAFRGIALHPESPWTTWAPYMVGRCILWQARVLEQEDPEYRPLLIRAQRQFEAVLLDDALAVSHNAARHLLFRVLTITDPEAAARMLGLRLMSELRAETRFRDVDRYLTVLDNANPPRIWDNVIPPFKQRIALGRRDRLTEWITAFQATEPEALDYTLARWRETRSTAWLIAALSKVDADHPAATELLQAAQEPVSPPARASLGYYRGRLLSQTERRSEARQVLDSLLPSLADLPSSRNRALALRAKLSRSYDQLLHYGVRMPASIGLRHTVEPARHAWRVWNENTPGRTVYLTQGLMPEAADALNSSVPLEEFVQLARANQTAPESVRRNIAVAAWVRAVLLKRWNLARSLTKDVALLAPQTQSSMEEFQSVSDSDAPFLAQLILLRFPGMSPKVDAGIGRFIPLEENHFDGYSWWWWHSHGHNDVVRPHPVDLDWVSPAERKQAITEWDEIIAMAKSGAGWLFASVQQECDRPQAPSACPEALYRAAANNAITGSYHHAMQYPGWDWNRYTCHRPSFVLSRRFPNSKWNSQLEVDEVESRSYDPERGFGKRYSSDRAPRRFRAY